MDKGFWDIVAKKKPFFVLAPMADVTDAALRRLVAKYGKPDVLWTEFVSADGLMSVGREHLLVDLSYSKIERPIVAQLFGNNPVTMEGAAQFVAELGFDGLDINMGCPDRTVMRQGAGGAMIREHKVAVAVIEAAKRGLEKGRKKNKPAIPLSIKTRIGYSKNELATWLPILLSLDLAAITVHARTVKEQSLVPARWEHIKEAVALRDASGKDTLIIGNGDVLNMTEGRVLAKETGADGIMIGRGIFGNPWVFNTRRRSTASRDEKLKALVELAQLFEKLLGGRKNYAIMKKHFKAYASGFDSAKELRVALMEGGNSAKEVKRIIKGHLRSLPA